MILLLYKRKLVHYTHSTSIQGQRSVLKRGGAHLPLSHTHTPTQTMVFLKPIASFVGTSKPLCNLRSVKCFRNRFVQLFRWFCFMVLVIGSSWVVWGQKMCSDLKSPMLQVLSNTSLKVFFSTTQNFCRGELRTPPALPLPSFAAYAIVVLLLLLRKSETLAFGILVGCLHYYKCPHCIIWGNVWVFPLPFKPNIFSFNPLLNTYFFHGPPSNPTSDPPYLIINERSLRRFFLLIRSCMHETKL